MGEVGVMVINIGRLLCLAKPGVRLICWPIIEHSGYSRGGGDGPPKRLPPNLCLTHSDPILT